MINYIKTHKSNFIILLLILPTCIEVVKDYIKENNEPIFPTIAVAIIINLIIFFCIEGIKKGVIKND